MHQANISLTTMVSHLRCSGQDQSKNLPSLNVSLLRLNCVLFSVAKSILTMGSCVCFCSHNLSFLCSKCRECSTDAVVSALEFRFRREIPSAT